MVEMMLEDQVARDAVHNHLHANMLVLAGAGAGKTHALVDRMVQCVIAGQQEVRHLAAITFTRKAAGEMRGRFYAELRKAAGTGNEDERARIDAALGSIDQCFIGTIHSFCGRLLREQPVAARLVPDFVEIEDRDEAVLRRELWDRFVQRCALDGDPLLDDLATAGMRTEDLYEFFRQRCVFNDLPLKDTNTNMPELVPVLAQAERLVDEAIAHVPSEPPKGPDGFMEMLTRFRNFREHRPLSTPKEQVAILNLLAGRQEVKVTFWEPERAYATELRDHVMPDFQANVLEPVLTQWRQWAYAWAAAFVDGAMVFYDEERHRIARLTFQDVLQKATSMLREYAHVRQFFQQRYRALFVDEFQDTDPVQAEMLLYLTGTDAEEKDWPRITPRAGSLFLVGDDKQSIYRFRRADVETFHQVRNQIAATGGEVVKLNTSFRSLGRLCSWINETFSALSNVRELGYQAEFHPLSQYRPDGADQKCVRRLSIDAIKYHPRGAIAAEDARRIAEFIAAAVTGNMEFNGTAGHPELDSSEALLDPHASPGDFLILTRTRGQLATYARALEQQGIAFDIVGGARLGDSLEVQALADILEVVYVPDNPIPLVAYLRGALVGLGDDELYAFHRAGGGFDYRVPVPVGLQESLERRLGAAVIRLERLAQWLESKTVVTALELLMEDLGLAAFAAAGEMGSSRAGSLLRLLALVRQWEGEGKHWGQVVVELRTLVEDESYAIEEMTLEAGQENVVRLMNLHQAKGLQAKVVFLADPYDTSAERRGVESHVSRVAEVPYLALPVRRAKGQYQAEIIAEPTGWLEDEETEARFLSAENLRLLYVAATRAENLLVVSCYKGNLDKGPWAPLYPYLNDVPELEPQSVGSAVATALAQPEVQESKPLETARLEANAHVLLAEWDQQRKARKDRFQEIQVPTYDVHSVTSERLDEELFGTPRAGKGREYGTVVHRIFERAIRGQLPEDEEGYIRHLLKEFGLADELAVSGHAALSAFRGSEIWMEVERTEDVYTEVAFAASDGKGQAPNVLRGIIDLVYRVAGGWKIVDYKTDEAGSEEEVEALFRLYAPQVESYATQWSKIAKEDVVEKGLWLTNNSRFVSVET